MQKNDQISKDLFQDIPLEQRTQMLKDNCYAHEETSVTRHYTDEEINDLKDELSTSSVEIAKLATEKEKQTKYYDGLLKPQKQKAKECISGLREGSYTNKEEVYLLDNQHEGVMDIYDSKGKFLYSRRLYEKERQTNIMTMSQQKAG